MSNINFDEFQRDIEAAESYLKGTNVMRSTDMKQGLVAGSNSSESIIAAPTDNNSATEFGDTLFFASELGEESAISESDALKSASHHDQISSLLTFSSVNPADLTTATTTGGGRGSNDFEKTIPRFNYSSSASRGGGNNATISSNATTMVPDSTVTSSMTFDVVDHKDGGDGRARALRPKPVLSSSLNKTIRRGRTPERPTSTAGSVRSFSAGPKIRSSSRSPSVNARTSVVGSSSTNRASSADRRPTSAQSPKAVSTIVTESKFRGNKPKASTATAVAPPRPASAPRSRVATPATSTFGRARSPAPPVSASATRSSVAHRPHTQALDALLFRSEKEEEERRLQHSSDQLLEQVNSSSSRYRFLKTKEDLRQEAEEAFNSVCKFTPKLATSRHGYGRSHVVGYDHSGSFTTATEHSSGSGSVSPVLTQRGRVEEMQMNHKKALQERIKQKQVNESLDVLSSCTFTPQISRGTEKIMRRLQAREAGDDISQGAEGEERSLSSTGVVGSRQFVKRSRSASPAGRTAAVAVAEGYASADDEKHVDSSRRHTTRSASASRERERVGGGSRNNTSAPGNAASSRLYRDAAHRYEHLQFLRAQVDSLSQNECSFQPSINESTNKILFTHNNYDYRPIHERLGDLHRGKQNAISAIRQSVEEREKEMCTFTPVISSKSHRMAMMRNNQTEKASSSSNSISISGKGATAGGTSANGKDSATNGGSNGGGGRYRHEYPYDFRNDSSEDEAQEEEEEVTYLGVKQERASPAVPAYDRLLSQGLEYKQHKTQLAIQREVADDIEFNQFKPKICKGTEMLLSKNDALARASFNQRQAMDMLRRKQHAIERNKLYNNAEEPLESSPTSITAVDHPSKQKGYSFAPPLSAAERAAAVSSKLHSIRQSKPTAAPWFVPNTSLSSRRSTALLEEAAANGNMTTGMPLHESIETKVDRMSKQQVQMYAAHRKELAAKVYSPEEYTFKPKIDAISRQLGRESSLKELVENRKGKSTREATIRQVTELQSKECPFKPKINSSNGGGGGGGGRLSLSQRQTLMQGQCRHNMGSGGEDNCLLSDVINRQYKKPTVDSFTGGGGVHINMQEPERMARDIRMHLREKEELRRQQLAVREIEELKHCTFQPDTSATSRTYYKYSHAPQPPRPPPGAQQLNEIDHRYTSPTSHLARQQQQQWMDESGVSINASFIPQMVPVRGLNRHLELRKRAEEIKQEQAEREREAFSVSKVHTYRREEDSSTIVQVG